MKISVQSACTSAAILALLSISCVANASGIVSGTVFENATSFPNSFSAVPFGSAPTNTGEATFTLTGTGNLFNLDSYGNLNNTGNPNADYTLASYLTSGGDTLGALTTVSGTVNSTDTINNSVFTFVGQTALTAGTTYTITHDDGMYLFLGGVSGTNTSAFGINEEINAPSPTSAEQSSFTVATSGLYNFDLQYAEVNGAPAVLSGNLGTIQPSPAPTPEPGSFVLLGSGLVAAAGMIRRRIAA